MQLDKQIYAAIEVSFHCLAYQSKTAKKTKTSDMLVSQHLCTTGEW